jgi:hypothetical protein
VNRWLGQAAKRFWRYFGGNSPEVEARLRRLREDSPPPSSFSSSDTPAAAEPPSKQRRGYADKMLRAGDYADKAAPPIKPLDPDLSPTRLR